MDIEKAFDKINYESLLQTIRKQFPEPNTPINKILPKHQNLRNKNQGHTFWS